MADSNIKVGCTIQTQDGREGIVRYIGPLHIAAGEWLGLELPENTGKNDGSVKGQRYFQCAPGFGIFVRKESAVKIVKQSGQVTKTNGPSGVNSTAAKPRPSSGVTADVARRRQSVMSAGSSAAGGSRLSMRSPTKSPTKIVPSSTTSSASTPRTGTPATTARTSDSSTKSRLSTTGRTLMGPPTSTVRSSASTTRQSIGGGAAKSSATRPSSVYGRSSLAGSRLSVSGRVASREDEQEAAPTSTAAHRSPPIREEAPTPVAVSETAGDESPESSASVVEPPVSKPPPKEPSRTASGGAPPPAEDKSRQAQVIKALETKVRTLQKQRQEDQAKLQRVQELESQSTRYEGIIQTLQKKLKTNQQEIQELKAKYEDAESRAQNVPDKAAEHETQLELATLDKEMAEERAEMFEAELEALKLKHEELELEVEILREENRELTSVMSPEEKASAGWLQMERETERLRQALVLLRDVSQQNEADLKNEIKELQQSLDELQQTASKYEDVVAKLNRSEDTNQHLKEQLEAAEANDDMLEAMAAERDRDRNQIEMLKRQVQDLEEHIQVTDELEAFHVDEEKRLHHQLDETEAMLNEKQRQAAEQEKMIEDLEYTLTKFRDVVQGLQSDIDELRRSREISELEAHEMSSKSRAMMDLNLQLQNSATKAQLKAIDLELGKMRAEQASLHLEIVQSFVPESFDVDRRPILALLCFRRIISKARLSKTILAEKTRDRPDLVQDNPLSVFAVMEQVNFIANLCGRFVQHMSSCSTADYMKYGGALPDLEPIEQTTNGWIEALRRDELAHDGPEHLQRMAGILVDLAEKLIPENYETKAAQLLSSISMVETYTENVASQAQLLDKTIQGRLGPPREEDEVARSLEKRFEQLGIKARTVKYISGKISQTLEDLQARSMCMGEATWSAFAEAEACAENLSRLTQRVGNSVLETLNKVERKESVTYPELMETITKAAEEFQQEHNQHSGGPVDFFDATTKQLQVLQAKVDDLNSRSADHAAAVEFEKLPAPWTVRAKEVKAQKVLSQDLQEELARLKSKIQEQSIRIGEKDKQLEEQQVKVELLESRAKETKVRDDSVKAMKEEIEKLREENVTATENLRRLQTEYQTMLETQAHERSQLEASKQRSLSDGPPGSVSGGVVDESAMLVRAKAEMDFLKVEIASLQASVRFLKYENHRLRIPVGEISKTAVEHAWLDPSYLKANPTRGADGDKVAAAERLRQESKDMFAELIELAKVSRPIRLRSGVDLVHVGHKQKQDAPTVDDGAAEKDKGQHKASSSAWRAGTGPDTTLYKVLRCKEELERWNEAKDDLVRRARLMVRSATSAQAQPGIGLGLWRHKEAKSLDNKMGLPLGFQSNEKDEKKLANAYNNVGSEIGEFDPSTVTVTADGIRVVR
ncbi:hypothetical protein HRR83_005152 [Exophiala dermatitidis]|uniref:CAP-Gly domain-containing protein n=2 Tax=Exophiala dermatitidis TaxID=5970 RepID=A0AAN6EUN7_EXODE|nr:hypothetical protein HRR75_004282 [Exophiala dermatitidis]KAJ4516934.1 hypothetical protein HRR74_004683 [Exophiala dermatitidis]KAJ4519887.1 hypothetical protein HRR73_003948 [Exophiala dermatitidis]KAJ4534304.1 hypothetical protein HRR76_006233 [Exophiala dermatitidis]KAJ4541475.1 hypothetical protein HRR77_006266 [Exophiala dermatitidis]